MALINCKECNKEVSEKAIFCPNCGAPVSSTRENIAAGAKLKTTQETSKKFKLHALISTSLVIVGIIWLAIILGDTENAPTDISIIPLTLLIVGLIWFMINRIRIWWHHK